jgi:hypothetical protein
MKRSLRRANVRWFSTKQKTGKRRRPSPMQLVGLRLNDLAKIFRARYGNVLPNDDAGRDDLMVAVHHLASLAHPRGHIAKWLDRRMLGVTTIGAIDENKAARTKRRRALDRQRKENARRANGIKPRKVYEGQSVSAAKPWKAEGISRASWYRRKAAETASVRETSPATA